MNTPRPARLRGHTRIELTDCRTGRRKIYEKDNLVTGALQEIFTPLGIYTDSNLLTPQGEGDEAGLLAYACGGLLLYDRAMPAETATRFAPAEAQVVGCGAYGAANTGENRLRGSFNSVESSIDPEAGTATFVYDFSTQQANGTIAAACLTHRSGGYLASGDTNLSNAACELPAGDTFGGRLSRTFLDYLDNAEDIPWLLELDEAADTVRLARPGAAADGGLQLTLETYPAMLRSLDLFWPRGQKPPHSEEVVPITATLLRSGSQAAYFAGWNYRGEDRTLYITNVGGTTCAANAALQVIAVNLDTKAETVYPLTNQTGVTLAGRLAGSLSGQTLSLSRRVACPLGGYVYNGYLYMRSQNQEGGAYRYFRIALDDAGDVEEVACNGDQMPYVHDAYGGRMYSYTGNGSPDHGVVLDTARNCLLRHEAFSSSATYNKRYDIRGRSILQLYCKDTGTGTDGVGLSLRPNYLATVNNLGETVQKTADQTMKVTYTLTRLSG